MDYAKWNAKRQKTIERKEKSQAIIKKWKERGLPELPHDSSEISKKEREQSEYRYKRHNLIS